MMDSEPSLADHMRPALLFLCAVLGVGLFVSLCAPPEPPKTWYDRYVEESCARCDRQGEPCCVNIRAAE